MIVIFKKIARSMLGCLDDFHPPNKKAGSCLNDPAFSMH